MEKWMALILVLGLGGTTTAIAQTQEEQQACTNDAFQFCQAAIPDRNRVFQCLVQNGDLISAACHNVMAPYLPVTPAAALAPAKKRSKAPRKTAKTAKIKGPVDLSPR